MNFKDIHIGKMAFVLGSGPSLRNLNPEILKGHISIAINGSILKAPEADYYFSCDYGMVLWKSWTTLKSLSCHIMMACNVGFTSFEHRLDRKVFEDISEYRRHYLKRKEGLEIDKNPVMISGSSSVHSAIHFAHLLGCSPIILVGCDCQYVDGKKHYGEFPGQLKDVLRDPNFEQYRRPLAPYRPDAKTDGELKHHLKVWENLRNQNPTLNIIDTSEGKLNMFPQMSIQEALKSYE